MEHPVRVAPKAPRGWLWLARCALAFFFIASLLMAVAILLLFLESASGNWHEWRTIFWFTVCVAALSCGLIPYILVVWNRWRERTRAKGLSQALIIGTFWFFVGWLVLSDSAFHGVSAFNPAGTHGVDAEVLQFSLGISLSLTLPAFLLLIGGIKILNFRSSFGPASAAPEPEHRSFSLRAAVGITLMLLLLPVALGFFTLTPDLSTLQFAVLEPVMAVGALPYVIVWRDLKNSRPTSQAQTAASALATGFLALLATGAVTYGIIFRWTPSSQPHQMSTWAELAFFALLGLANIAVLRASGKSMRPSETEGGKKRSVWGTLAVPICLIVFGLCVMLASAST